MTPPTVTFVGTYACWSAAELLTHGHNQDHRPDLKQLVLGMNVTAGGAVPLSHRVFDGNPSDDRVHPANHRALQRLLNRADFIYVADGKLATEENLQKFPRGLFVSVMPRTRKEARCFPKGWVRCADHRVLMRSVGSAVRTGCPR